MTVKIDGTNTIANPAFTGADTDTGLQCGTNEVKLVTGGTARATVDSSGRLLVGTASGTGKFIVQDSSLPKIQANYAGSKHMEFGVGGSGCGFAMTTGHFMTFNHQPYADRGTDNNLTERLRILSDGTIRLASGCPGIDFSQIQTNASGMSSETLDSYEEGTWTADLVASTNNNGAFTFDGNTGSYIKIGKMCFISIFLRWSGSTRTGSNMELRGLPFNCQGNNDRRGGFQITYRNSAFVNLSNVSDLTLRTEQNQGNARFQYGTGDGNAVTELSGSNFNTAGGNMMITGCYEVA